MTKHFIIKTLVGGLGVAGTLAAQATVIDFSSVPLNVTGPSTYFAAGARRDLTATDNSVTISGGTVLSAETFLPANSSTLYGTAFFGTTTAAGPYLPTITLNFANPVTNFFLDVYNGQVFNVTYTVADNAGHAASFLLAPNLSSGTSQIGFAAAGNQITITSDAGPVWDFSIDNIHYNETLPTTITNYTVPTVTTVPPSVSTPDIPPVTLVYVGPPPSPPQVTLAEALQREADGLDNQKHRQKQKGKNGEKLDFRLEAQGFDDSAPTTPPTTPVPLPATLPLLGAALSGLGVFRRRRS